jgi:hypothetical protein
MNLSKEVEFSELLKNLDKEATFLAGLIVGFAESNNKIL